MSKLKDRMKQIFAGRPRACRYDEHGREILDPKPLHYPTGIKRPPTQEDRLRRILAHHQALKDADQTYRDETDFDIDEPDMLSPHENAAYLYDMQPVEEEAPAKRPQTAGEAGASSPTPDPEPGPQDD